MGDKVTTVDVELETITVNKEDIEVVDNRENGNEEKDKENIEVKLYLKRWFILFIFSLYSFTNSMNWIIFAPIAVTVMEEYDVGF